MASVLGKRKSPSGAPPLAKRPSTAATKKAKKSATRKPTAAAAVEKNSRPRRREESDGSDGAAAADAQEVFRRYFEAAFEPLPDAEPARKQKGRGGKAGAEVAGESDESDEDLDEEVGADWEGAEGGDEWAGLSGDDDGDDDDDDEEAGENVVQVVDHSSSAPGPVASMSKRELKAFMSSKPPSQTTSSPAATTAPAKNPLPTDDPGDNDKSNLANDLALQRLLSESHLLSRHSTASPFSNPAAGAAKPFSSGKLRARQTDLRAQALAPGVRSLFKQESMPMAMRKGMNAAAAGREGRRRRQARENGIVLEREAPAPSRGARKSGGRAERSVDGPSVGRMKGAELRLSERDIRSIEGPSGGGGGGGGRGGRGGRGGGGRGGRR